MPILFLNNSLQTCKHVVCLFELKLIKTYLLSFLSHRIPCEYQVKKTWYSRANINFTSTLSCRILDNWPWIIIFIHSWGDSPIFVLVTKPLVKVEYLNSRMHELIQNMDCRENIMLLQSDPIIRSQTIQFYGICLEKHSFKEWCTGDQHNRNEKVSPGLWC